MRALACVLILRRLQMEVGPLRTVALGRGVSMRLRSRMAPHSGSYREREPLPRRFHQGELSSPRWGRGAPAHHSLPPGPLPRAGCGVGLAELLPGAQGLGRRPGQVLGVAGEPGAQSPWLGPGLGHRGRAAPPGGGRRLSGGSWQSSMLLGKQPPLPWVSLPSLLKTWRWIWGWPGQFRMTSSGEP